MSKNPFFPVAVSTLVGLMPLATGCAAEKAGKAEVEEVKDIAYYDGPDADPVKHKLDLYLPKGQKDFPVLFFVHGGAWTSGDKRMYAGVGRLFAQNGLGTVVINYRLSPKVQHPEHIKDVARAFAWTHAHIGKYGGKVDEMFVCGHSAGGHLVALLATDETFLKAEGLSTADIKGVVPISGVYNLIPPLFASVFGKDTEAYKNAFPLQHVSANRPPFLIIYGDRDFPFCDMMSEEMGRALRKCHCEAETLEVKDRDHISIMLRLGTDHDPTRQAVLDFVTRLTHPAEREAATP